MEIAVEAELVAWRGPSPYVWLRLPDEACDAVRVSAAQASYGWGAVPVQVQLGATRWETSLMPRDGGYLLPVKDSVRRAEGVSVGDTVTVALAVATRGGRRAGDQPLP